MCYTPIVSLATAIIEFIIVIYLFRIINDKRLRFLPYFVFFLGLYQLTEFFLCITNNLFWARLGFASYTLLPILFLQLFYDFYHKNFNKWLYAVPLSFIGLAFLHPEFISEATCSSFFVMTNSPMIRANTFLGWIYGIYYLPLTFGLMVNIFLHNRTICHYKK